MSSAVHTIEDPSVAYFRERLERGWADRLALVRSFCPPGARTVDLGCGWGEYALPLATIAASVDAIDVNGSLLAFVARLASERGLENVRTHQVDFIEWAAARAGTVDVAVCTQMLMLLPPWQRRKMIGALRTVLAPGGRCFVDFFGPTFFVYRLFQRNLPFIHRLRALAALLRWKSCLTRRVFEREAAAEGFRVVLRPEQIVFPDSDFTRSRAHEEKNFDTILGPYVSAYLLEAGE